MQAILILQLLVLLTVANGTAVIAKKVLADRFAWPVDGGAIFFDGQPIFGPAKTVRGIVLTFVTTPLVACLMGLQWELGIVIAALAMAGDLISSFVKRRMALPSSSMALGLDHIPESLLPLLGSALLLPLNFVDVLAGVTIFCAGALLLSPILYRFNLRDRPY
jgi:CDP-diglyceride synthetase